ncbi:MAG: hypothetical protein OEN01_09110 [Candidatus Krumholzibacteria bacterium]|nr:hypothetical protein [Candidatus Krumholzibacteria bacterium]
MTNQTQQKRLSKQIRKGIEKAARQARKVSGRVAHAVAETPEFISLRRNDHALRSEMDDCYRTIGKRVQLLHKRSRGENPFNRFKAIMGALERLEYLEDEYRDNRARLTEVKRQMRRGRR